MRLTKHEHAALVLVESGHSLVIDPGSFTSPIEDLVGLVGVVLTHEHPDHWTAEHLTRLLKAHPGVPIYGPEGVVHAAAGFEVTAVHPGDRLDLGEALRLTRPTAIIGSNDILALGVIGALKREGLSVPGDVSVAGFDGISIGRLIDPVLTTIEMPDVSMGAAAASLLLDIAENDAPARHLDVPFTMRPGGTVRAI